MTKNKISIITTYYNCQQYLEQSINSVLSQKTNIDGENIIIEYILVNDCSTDNSLQIVNDIYEKKNMVEKSNIYMYIYNTDENVGCGAARKFGIEKATGDYFMFLDADDYYINDDFVCRAFKDITENSADIVEYGVLFNDATGNQHYVGSKSKIILHDGLEGVYNIFNDNTIKFNVWSKIYTKEIIASKEYDSNREFEDVRTIPYWVKNANKIVIMPNIEINYRANSNSIIRNDNIKTRLGTIKAITEISREFKDNYKILKAIYKRALIDISAIMENKTSMDVGFIEMMEYNNEMLSYLYPKK